MVSVEDGGGRLPLVMDKDPEGLCEIVEQSRILDATLVREVSRQLLTCMSDLHKTLSDLITPAQIHNGRLFSSIIG